MPSIGSVFLFAAGAAAQLTTSVWLPGSRYYDGYSSSDFVDTLNASVIAKDGDRTTMALNAVLASATRGSYRYNTRTMTFIGTTSFESVSTYNSRVGYETTYSMGCSLAESNRVVCVEATQGPNQYSDYCSRYTRSTTPRAATSTRRITFTNPPQTVTQIIENDDDDYYYTRYSAPSYCLSGSTLPESIYKDTTTVRPETYQLVVTAAAEKLTASGGPSPTSSGASNSNSGSGPQNTGSSNSPNGGAPPNTGNAAPMVTVAPAMVGLGAAAAAFLL